MKIIDLHTHSINSDGTLTIKEMIQMMNDLNVDIAAITDHDSVKGYYQLYEIKDNLKLKKPIKIIPGTELGCSYDGVIRDVLAYGIDIDIIDEYVTNRYSAENKLAQQKMLLKEYKKVFKNAGLIFDESIDVSKGKKSEAYINLYEDIIKHSENLEKYPFLENINTFFWNYCSNKDTKFFVNESATYPTIKEGIDLIHKAGGLAFLAHPCMYRIGKLRTLQLINHAIECGIDGIEVMHSQHKFDDNLFLAEVARKYHLYASGGSDFHGDTKPGISMVSGKGDLYVAYNMLKDWVNDVKCIELK